MILTLTAELQMHEENEAFNMTGLWIASECVLRENHLTWKNVKRFHAWKDKGNVYKVHMTIEVEATLVNVMGWHGTNESGEESADIPTP